MLTMRNFLLSLNAIWQVIIIIATTIVIAFVVAFSFSICFDIGQLAGNTGLISSIYQVMGTIYAILLTFTLWGVWQNFITAGLSVQEEAYALMDLIHVIGFSPNFDANAIRKAAIDYTSSVINQEWPRLKTYSSDTINLQEKVHCSSYEVLSVIQHLQTSTQRDDVILEQALHLVSKWLDARRSRILIARGNSAKALWPLLFIGAIVLFSFHGLFVATTFGIWMALLFGISLVIGVTFYLIFSLDCPFSGPLSIDPEPHVLALNILKLKKP